MRVQEGESCDYILDTENSRKRTEASLGFVSLVPHWLLLEELMKSWGGETDRSWSGTSERSRLEGMNTHVSGFLP